MDRRARGHSLRRLTAAGSVLCALILHLSGPASAANEPRRIAVFNFELIDTSLEGEIQGESQVQQDRLVLISNQLCRQLAASGKYVVVDVTPAAEAILSLGYIHGCNGCELDIARALSADLALTGTVQKVSNLILNINVYLKDVATGDLVRVESVDIRGNTDSTWSRGLSYLLRNRLLKD